MLLLHSVKSEYDFYPPRKLVMRKRNRLWSVISHITNSFRLFAVWQLRLYH